LARALLVGCGCRGRALGQRLREQGWEVRGTTRDAKRAGAIEEASIEAAVADPDRVATVLEHVADVAVVAWLLGSAEAGPEQIAAIHGPRLERLLEELVDTPVRGFLYEAAGSVDPSHLGRGVEIVAEVGETWRIPVAVLDREPGDWRAWTDAAQAAIIDLVA
jgi:nucleoside-diphosphate-sugar epimerase